MQGEEARPLAGVIRSVQPQCGMGVNQLQMSDGCKLPAISFDDR